jgi:predicted Holliday junction resolvase-like endonuclease
MFMWEVIVAIILAIMILWYVKQVNFANSELMDWNKSLETKIIQLENDRESEKTLIMDKQELIGQLGQNLRFVESSLTETAQIVVNLEETLAETKAEEKKQKGRAASAHTTKGQILEKWCPFLEHPQIEPYWQPKDWSFMGSPIDYIVWDANGIVFLDVKSGQSQLTKKQRMIRDLIRAGNVEWREIRLQ